MNKIKAPTVCEARIEKLSRRLTSLGVLVTFSAAQLFSPAAAFSQPAPLDARSGQLAPTTTMTQTGTGTAAGKTTQTAQAKTTVSTATVTGSGIAVSSGSLDFLSGGSSIHKAGEGASASLPEVVKSAPMEPIDEAPQTLEEKNTVQKETNSKPVLQDGEVVSFGDVKRGNVLTPWANSQTAYDLSVLSPSITEDASAQKTFLNWIHNGASVHQDEFAWVNGDPLKLKFVSGESNAVEQVTQTDESQANTGVSTASTGTGEYDQVVERTQLMAYVAYAQKAAADYEKQAATGWSQIAEMKVLDKSNENAQYLLVLAAALAQGKAPETKAPAGFEAWMQSMQIPMVYMVSKDIPTDLSTEKLREIVDLMKRAMGDNPAAYYAKALESLNGVFTKLSAEIKKINGTTLEGSTGTEYGQVLELVKLQAFIASTKKALSEYEQAAQGVWKQIADMKVLDPQHENAQYLLKFASALAQGKEPPVPAPATFNAWVEGLQIPAVVIMNLDVPANVSEEELQQMVVMIKEMAGDHPVEYYQQATKGLSSMLEKLTAEIKKINESYQSVSRSEMEAYVRRFAAALSQYQSQIKDVFQPASREYLVLAETKVEALVQDLLSAGDLDQSGAHAVRILDFAARYMIANSKSIIAGKGALQPSQFLPKNISDADEVMYLKGLSDLASKYHALVPVTQFEPLPSLSDLDVKGLAVLVDELKQQFGDNPEGYFQGVVAEAKKGIAGTIHLIEDANSQILGLQDKVNERKQLQEYLQSVYKAAQQFEPKINAAYQPIVSEDLVMSKKEAVELLDQLPADQREALKGLLAEIDAALYVIQLAKGIQNQASQFPDAPAGFGAFAAKYEIEAVFLKKMEPLKDSVMPLSELRAHTEALRKDFGDNPKEVYRDVLAKSKKTAARMLFAIEQVNGQLLALKDKAELYSNEIRRRAALEKEWNQIASAVRGFMEEMKNAWSSLDGLRIEDPKNELGQYLNAFIDAAVQGKTPTAPEPEGFDDFARAAGILSVAVFDPDLDISKLSTSELETKIAEVKKVIPNAGDYYAKASLQIRKMLQDVTRVIKQINQAYQADKLRAAVEKEWNQIASASRGFMEEMKNAWSSLDGVRIQNPKNELEKYLNAFMDAAAQGKVPTAPKPEGFDKFAQELGMISVVVVDPDLNISKLSTAELKMKIVEVKKAISDPEAYYAKASLQIRKMLKDIQLAIAKINQSAAVTAPLTPVQPNENPAVLSASSSARAATIPVTAANRQLKASTIKPYPLAPTNKFPVELPNPPKPNVIPVKTDSTVVAAAKPASTAAVAPRVAVTATVTSTGTSGGTSTYTQELDQYFGRVFTKTAGTEGNIDSFMTTVDAEMQSRAYRALELASGSLMSYSEELENQIKYKEEAQEALRLAGKNPDTDPSVLLTDPMSFLREQEHRLNGFMTPGLVNLRSANRAVVVVSGSPVSYETTLLSDEATRSMATAWQYEFRKLYARYADAAAAGQPINTYDANIAFESFLTKIARELADTLRNIEYGWRTTGGHTWKRIYRAEI